MRYDASLGPGPRDCESSGVRNTTRSHGERNDQVADFKRVAETLGDHSTIPSEVDEALGPEPRRFRMSLWQKPRAQGRTTFRTPELSHRYHRDLLVALWNDLEPRGFATDVT